MKIKCLFMDVDGTLTDGKIYMGDNGEIIKAFSVKDGAGIKSIQDHGVIPVVITGRESAIVQKRCEELGITKVHQNVDKKLDIIKKYEVDFPNQVFAYIGDDSNDAESMEYMKKHGGLTACPCDAHGSVKEIADYICQCAGGDGAVREFVDYLIKRMDKNHITKNH